MKLRRLFASFALFSALALTIGCPPGPGNGDGDGDGDSAGDSDGDGDGDGDDTGGNGTSDDVCAAGKANSLSVCQVQNPQSPNYAARDVETVLRRVVVTSDVFEIQSGTLSGFFVSDDPPTPWGGVLVSMPADSGFTVNRGDVIDELRATVREFGSDSAAASETQLEIGTDGFVSVLQGETSTIAPIEIDDVADLNQADYEGVLVTISDLSVTNAASGGGRFQVTHDSCDDDTSCYLQIGPSMLFYEADTGEEFSSMTGMLRYNTFSTGRWELCPRDEADVVSLGATYPTVSIPQLRDPGHTDYVGECPWNQDDCPAFHLENVVVVSQAIVVDEDDETGVPYLYGFYVADPTAADEEGHLQAYSGIFVSLAVSRAGLENDYSFGDTGEGDFKEPSDGEPGDFPQIGDVVSVAGENTPYFDNAQLTNIRYVTKKGTVDSLSMAMPKPAFFTPDTAGALKGGRPEYPATPAETNGDQFGDAAMDAVEPSDEIESWEGVLVELSGVSTIDACYPIPYNPGGSSSSADDAFQRDFGYYLVTGDVEVGTLFDYSGAFDTAFAGSWGYLDGNDEWVSVSTEDRTCDNLGEKTDDSRKDGQVFDSLVGVIDYSYDVWRLNPRNPADYAPDCLFAEQGGCMNDEGDDVTAGDDETGDATDDEGDEGDETADNADESADDVNDDVADESGADEVTDDDETADDVADDEVTDDDVADDVSDDTADDVSDDTADEVADDVSDDVADDTSNADG